MRTPIHREGSVTRQTYMHMHYAFWKHPKFLTHSAFGVANECGALRAVQVSVRRVSCEFRVTRPDPP